MLVTCPYCQKQHRLRQGFVPDHKSAAHCKGCGRRFLLEGSNPATTQKQEQTEVRENVSEPQSAPAPGDAAFSTPQPPQDPPNEAANSAIGEIFPDLKELPPEGFALAALFKPDSRGGYRNSLNLHKAKILRATALLLIDKILAPGEMVLRIASGIAYFRFEIPYANGILTCPLNHYALVATTSRLLLINLDHHLIRPDRYVFQIPWGEITEVSRGFFGSSLIIKTDAGKVWDFTTVKRALATEMTEFIGEFIAKTEAPDPKADYYSQLCPVCFQPVPDRIPSCPHCLTPYKSVGEAMKKSLILPGLGTIYLSYNSLGITEMLGYLLTWLLTIILVIIGIPGGILGGGMLVLAYHLMSAYMAGQMARKGYIPEQQHQDDSIPDHDQATVAPS